MSWFVEQLLLRNIPVPRTFVETGAYHGNGIQAALESGAFDAVYSIELSERWALHCQQRFAKEPKVTVHRGDSAIVLETMALPSTPILFYLDAHYSGGPTAGIDIDNGCPLLRELAVIAKRGVKGDIIFIDDMRLMGKDTWGGVFGDPDYPYTRFDFTHITGESINKALEGRSVTKIEMCADKDRLLIVL